MIKTFCDRCGKEIWNKDYLNSRITRISYNYNVTSEYGQADLCKECITELQTFMNTKPIPVL